MKKINIVKSNLEFNNIIHKGNKYVSNIFYTYVLINNYNYNRYGIAISTKIGNAVIRNKYKRQIKDIIDKIKINTYGYDIIFIARQQINQKNYLQIKEDIIKIINMIGEKNEKQKN